MMSFDAQRVDSSMSPEAQFCGKVAIVGRPNVGKSTLLNRLIGQKLSITSRKPQTTRQQILGVKTIGRTQIVYLDTPGVDHWQKPKTIHRLMNRSAVAAMRSVDMILLLVEQGIWTEADEERLALIQRGSIPIILGINKVDKLADKERLLPYMEAVSKKGVFLDMVPLSAKKGDNVSALERLITKNCPQASHLYPEDALTDRSKRFLAAEFVREKIVRILGQELPYVTAVDIELFQEDDELCQISAVIYVEKKGQKPIVIGKGGENLRNIGTQARLDMEALFEKKVFLQTWVKVKSDWTENEHMLRHLGLGQSAAFG